MRALAAETVAAPMPRASRAGRRDNPGLVDADPGIVVERASAHRI